MKALRYLLIAPLLASSLFAAGCGTTTGDRALSGGLLGAGAGAAIGSMSGNAGTGALVGGALGAAAGAIIPPDQVNLGDPVWRDHGREPYYEGPAGLMAVPMTERDGTLEAGSPQVIFAIHTQGNVAAQPHNFEVAAHGQKFLVNTIVDDSDNAPLEVTLHWDASLTK